MKNNLSCELVQDLLPSYIDGLTGEVTNTAIREHLSRCEKCSATLEAMAEPYTQIKISEEKKEIDFLKKTRRKNLKVVLLSIISVVLVISIFVSSLPYFIKYDLDDSMVLCSVTVEGDAFTVKATADHKRAVITDIVYNVSESGILNISFEGRTKTSFDSDKLFSWSYTSNKVKSVMHQGKILWEDGEHISPITSAVYKYRTPYIGDMSHNSVIAGALDMYEYLGSFTNKLTTVKEPYGWELIFSYPLMPQQKTEKEKLMKSYAYVLLGVIGNLSEVKFTYGVLNSDGDEKKLSFTVTKQQASTFFGEDIKKCSEDINNLQSLIEKTNLNDIAYIDLEDTDSFEAEITETARIKLFNASDAPIKKIEVKCKETDLSSANGYEDDSLFNIGKRPVITTSEHHIYLEALSKNAYDKKRLGNITAEVILYDWDNNAYEVKQPIVISAFLGAAYSYTIVGDLDNGFKLIQ